MTLTDDQHATLASGDSLHGLTKPEAKVIVRSVDHLRAESERAGERPDLPPTKMTPQYSESDVTSWSVVPVRSGIAGRSQQ